VGASSIGAPTSRRWRRRTSRGSASCARFSYRRCFRISLYSRTSASRCNAGVLDTLNERALALIADVGITALAGTLAADLPYGRKRALELATTLALDPEMLLLDEPTAGMGREDIDRIAALIRSAAANRTVLMVEHNLGVVAALSDRITVLTRGRILAEGDYAAISANPEVREAYLGVGHG
jgi:branched-chain amino acid transport system ATP-binding protein